MAMTFAARVVRAFLPAAQRPVWEQACKDEQIAQVVNMARYLARARAVPLEKPFAVGLFDVTVAKQGWAVQISRDGEQVLDYVAAQGEQNQTYAKQHALEDNSWVGDFMCAYREDPVHCQTYGRTRHLVP